MIRVLAIAAVVLSASPLHSQELRPEAPVIELSFSRASGRAGEEIELPISLKSEEMMAAPFRLTLGFRPSVLEYRGFKMAYLAKYAGWTMKAHLRKPDAAKAVLEIEIDPAQQGLFPSGVVGYVQFTIRKGVPDGDIPLDAGLQLPESVPLTAKVLPAKVTVYSKLIISCFFYMH